MLLAFYQINTEARKMKRRSFLEGTISIAMFFGLLKPERSLAAVEPIAPFAARNEVDVIRALFGDARVIPGDAVRIAAPIQTTRGKGIPFKVSCG
jgi:hypothetical protein